MEYSVILQRWSLCVVMGLLCVFFFFITLHPADQSLPLAAIVASIDNHNHNRNMLITNCTSMELDVQQGLDIVVPLQNTSNSLSDMSQEPRIQKKSAGNKPSLQLNITTSTTTTTTTKSNSSVEEKCDIYDGMWVYDPKNYPLYRAHQCPFLSDQVSCQKNGRPDSDYERWRWKPRGCDIPQYVQYFPSISF